MSSSKYVLKEYGTLKLYSKEESAWVYVRPNVIGDIKQSIHTKDHAGWMICDGRSLNRADYPKLFALIGTAFGSDDSSTFKIPDARGRVTGTVGQGSGLTNRTLGAIVGEETHTLTISEMPSHTHTNNSSNALGLMTSNGANTASGGLDVTAGEPNLYATPQPVVINSTGGGAPHNVMQPTLFIANTFIFALHY